MSSKRTPGRRLDQVMLWALLLGGGYLFFAGSTGSVPAALALSAAWLALLLLVKKSFVELRLNRYEPNRASRLRAAQARVNRWMMGDPWEALNESAQLLCGFYRLEPPDGQSPVTSHEKGQPVRFDLLQEHPSGQMLDATRLLNLWKAQPHDRPETLVVMTTGKVHPDARSFAQELKLPQVRLFDGAQLSALLIKSGHRLDVSESEGASKRATSARWRTLYPHLVNRAKSRRYALYALMLMALFWVLGSPAYLICALACLALCILGFKQPNRPATLS